MVRVAAGKKMRNSALPIWVATNLNGTPQAIAEERTYGQRYS